MLMTPDGILPKPITANQTVIDMGDVSRFRRLNPFVSPLVTMLDKIHGTTHVPTEWELIGEKLIEMQEIADRLREMESAA